MTDESTALEGVDAADDAMATDAVDAPETEDLDAAEAEDGEQEDVDTEDGDQEGEDEEEAEDEEELEFDFGGNKLTVPKGKIPEELAAKVQTFSKEIWADYTRKSQEIGERSKSLEAREGAVEKMVGLNDEALSIYSRGLHLRQELEQFAKVDMEQLWQSDKDRARRVSDAHAAKQAELQNIVSTLSAKEQELSQAQTAEAARRMEEGRTRVTKTVKNFDEKALVDYAVSRGMPESDAKQWPVNPLLAEMAWESMMYRRMRTEAGRKKPAPTKAPAADTKPVKALPSKGKARAAPDAEKLSTDAWMKLRMAGKI
jgi:hypothetical protein